VLGLDDDRLLREGRDDQEEQRCESHGDVCYPSRYHRPTLRIPLIARYTWTRHWPAAALEGLSWGVVGLGAFAVKRSLGGPDRAVPLFIALWQGVWIFTPAIGTLLARADPQKLWRGLAVGAYLPVMLVGLVAIEPTAVAGHGTGNLPLFLVLMFLFYATAIASVPHRGALLRTNYPRVVRGRMWGYLTAVSFLAALGTAKLAAHLLDRDPRWLRVVFPAAAILGALGFWTMGRIRWRHQRRRRVHQAVGMRAAWREAWRILREDSAFRTYEIGFMLYGCGFLCSIGLLILYAEDELGLSYGEWTTAQFLAFPAAQVVGAALLGRLSDRIGILKTTALAFGGLGLFFGRPAWSPPTRSSASPWPASAWAGASGRCTSPRPGAPTCTPRCTSRWWACAAFSPPRSAGW
jgi:MFS family permease